MNEPDPLKGAIIDWFLVDDPVSCDRKATDEAIRRFVAQDIKPFDGVNGMLGPFLLDESETDWAEDAAKLRERLDLLGGQP